MKIIVSACLLGHNCKYNGGNNRNQETMKSLPYVLSYWEGFPLPANRQRFRTAL